MKMRCRPCVSVLLALVVGLPAVADEARPLLETLQTAGPKGAGSRELAQAWRKLAESDPKRLPAILEGLDGASPLAANWIGSAADAVARRTLDRGGTLPSKDLKAFLLDTRHSARARRLAYEWLVQLDPTTPERLLPGMLHDPSAELRRDAVDRLIGRAAKLSDEAAAAEYQTALSAARDLDQIRSLAGRLDKLGRKVDLARQLGCLVRWRVIGPWDNTDRKGFDTAYPPEQQTEPSFSETYEGKPKKTEPRTLKWIDHATEHALGEVDLNKVLVEEKNVVAYLATEFLSDKEQDVELRMTSNNAIKVWANGQLVARHEVYHGGGQFDQYAARASLRPGRNLILAKVCQNAQTQSWARKWSFQLRVCDPTGGAVLAVDREPAKND